MTYLKDPPSADAIPQTPSIAAEPTANSTIVAIGLGVVGIFLAAYILS